MESIKLSNLVKTNYKEYLQEVVSGRAISDMYDGLKPAQRRLIWTAYMLGIRNNKAHVKSARITGECMARYHPHGDAYNVLVGMAQACSVFPFIDGQGGWGFLGNTTSASAPRYTEAKLSKIADNILLDEDYLKITKTVPNYDDTAIEPVRLPAKLPILLLIGSSGIAVGTRANIPAFTWESLKPILMTSFKREITWKDCVDLKINDILGALYAGTKDEWYSYLKTGIGSLKMTSKMKIEGKQIRLLSLSQNPDTALDKLEKQDYIKSVTDLSNIDGINILITFKPQYKEVDMKDLEIKIRKLLTNSMNYSLATNVIKTRVDIDVKIESKTIYKTNATYIESTIPKIINDWVKWRIQLEKLMLTNRINIAKIEINKIKLFIYAISKLNIIFKILKNEKNDIDIKLAKVLNITKEQANQILDKTVRSLSNLSKDKLLKDVKDLNKKVVNDTIKLKKPIKTIYDSIKLIDFIIK